MGNRHTLLEWAAQGHLPAENVRAAAELAGVIPGRSQWLRFVDRLLLFGGAVFLGAGVIFFVAYNWQALGRYAKFGMVEVAIAGCLAVVAKIGIERVAGKATLLAAALLVGALLALVGQTYQTGADTCELFATWALAILPWVLLARFAAFWMLWLAIVNVAVVFYFQAFRGLFWFFDRPDALLWTLFALDGAVLVAWELLAARSDADWLRERWALRLLCTACGVTVTSLAAMQILDPHDVAVAAVPVWGATLLLAYSVYRRHIRDLFVLAGGVLSVVVVVATFLGKNLLHHDAAGGFLLIGLVVLGISAAGGWWLREIAQEEAA